MSGFSESSFVRKLADVNPTQQSIQTLSMWMLHYKRSAKEIVHVWLREVKREKRPAKLLTFLYLANDVIQTARKKFPPYQPLFQKVLLDALPHMGRLMDRSTLGKLKRILQVWKERSVYPDDVQEKLVLALTSHLASDCLDLFRDLASTPPPPPVGVTRSPPQKAVSPPTSPTEGEGSGRAEEEEEPSVHDLLRASPAPEDDLEPPTTAELVASLTELQNPASFDEETRNQIAAYPEAVANPALLKELRSREEAERLFRLGQEAEALVTGYCGRLEKEMAMRKETQAALAAYLAEQKHKAEKTQELLGRLRQRCVGLEAERREVERHIEALPDIEALAPDLALLPSPSELFASVPQQ